MTDKEKAEEYVNAHCCYQRQDFIRTYLTGLADGRKAFEEELGWITDTDVFNVATKLERCDELEKENTELKEQIEKMKNIIYEYVDFCFYCPLTNECVNSEGTCPYAYATEERKKIAEWITKNGS